MIPEIEVQFINRFIMKNRRERLIYELSSQKRDHALFRLTFQAERFLSADHMHPYKLIDKDRLYKDMLALGGSPEGAFLLTSSDNDPNPMPLFDALDRTIYKYGGAFFVIAQGASLAYYEAEPSHATTKKYLIY